MRTRTILMLLPVLTGLCAGCASDSDRLPPPTSTADLVLNPNEREVLATMRVGGALRVILPPPAEPGYEWEIVANNPGRVLQQITGLRPVPDAPGKLAVTFQATRPRRSRLLFVAVKPGVADATAAEQFLITIGINADPPPPGS